MLPFSIQLKHGEPVYEQILAAVRRACFRGELRHGEPFPSVRVLSQELRISPATAHKVVALLKGEGLLAPNPGIGMVVIADALPDRNGRQARISEAARRLVREAKDLSLELKSVTDAVREAWEEDKEN